MMIDSKTAPHDHHLCRFISVCASIEWLNSAILCTIKVPGGGESNVSHSSVTTRNHKDCEVINAKNKPELPALHVGLH